jgi:hypothetical protein
MPPELWTLLGFWESKGPPRPTRAFRPLRAGLALQYRSFTPKRPDIGADHAAFGAYRPPVQVKQHGVIWPAVRIDDCVVVAIEPLSAVDQQSSDAMRADMPEGDWRPLVALRSSLGRWVVVRIAVTHSVSIRFEVVFAAFRAQRSL